MRTLFVTGAEGFVGTHMMQYLRQKGYEVVAGVRNRARKLALERRFGKALVCEVADAINVARVITSVKPDGVIHLAGLARPDRAADDPLAAYQSIATAWANVLDAVRRSVPRARVLMVSAGEVYGAAGADGRPLTEDAEPRPTDTFGALKVTAETIAHTFFRNYHLNVMIARPFHHVGPGQSTASYYGAAAQKLAQWDAAVNGRELHWPDLDCQRDLLHVQDVVEAYERLLQDGRPNEVYNVCSGQARPCRQILEIMTAAISEPVTLVNQDRPQDPGAHITCLCGDNAKICRELGWHPSRAVEDAARELVRSFQVVATPETAAGTR